MLSQVKAASSGGRADSGRRGRRLEDFEGQENFGFELSGFLSGKSESLRTDGGSGLAFGSEISRRVCGERL